MQTIYLNWEEWQKYCAEHGLDPRKQLEDGRDLGGGNSIEIVCHDDPPEEYKEPAPAELQNCKCPIIMPEEEDE